MSPWRCRLVVRVVRGRLAARLDEEDGVSLVEVMIAAFILSVALLALMSTATAGLLSVSGSRQRQLATVAASRAIEQARGLGYTALAMRTSDSPSPPATYDVEGNGTSSEQVVATANGGVRRAVPFNYQSGGLTVRTHVTWYASNVLGSKAAKRVTTEVSWSNPDGRVRQSTIVTEADRGLPRTLFDVSPRQPTLYKSPGQPFCFDHTLTNLGERDQYQYVLASVVGYTVAGWIDLNANGVRNPGEDLVSGGSGTFTAPAPAAVDRGDTRLLQFCYTPTSSSNTDLSAEVRVHSVSDPTRLVRLRHAGNVTTVAYAINPPAISESGVPGQTFCFDHTLANSGSADTHDFRLPNPTTQPGVTGYAVTAYADINNDGTFADHPGAGSTTVHELLIDQNSDGRVDTDVKVASGGTLKLRFCYTPTSGGQTDLVAQVQVRSALNMLQAGSNAALIETKTINHTGLVVSSFVLDPATQSLTRGSGVAFCFPHTLRITGAADSYAISVQQVTGYTASAHVDTNRNGVPEELAVTGVAKTSGEVPLLFCYSPTSADNRSFSGGAIVTSTTRGTTATASDQGTVTFYSFRLSDPGTRTTVTTTTGATYPFCFTHTLTNDGEPDTYTITPPQVSGYTVAAFVRQPAATQGSYTGPVTTTGVLATGAALDVAVCYSGGSTSFTANTTVRSTTNTTVSRTVTHTRPYTFSVTPGGAPIVYGGGGGDTFCFEHTITNTGLVADRYDLVTQTVQWYRTDVYSDENGDGWLTSWDYLSSSSPVRIGSIAAGGSRKVWICYAYTAAGNAKGAPINTTATMRSVGDPTFTRQVTHVK